MAQLHRPWSLVVPAFVLLIAPACGGGGETSDDSTSAGPSTSTDPGTTTGTPDPDPTTGSPTGNPSSSPTTDEPTTQGPTTDDPGTTTSTDPTGETTTTTTGDTDPDTSTTTDTGDTDPGTSTGDGSDIPEIPDDGMPSSAHYKKVPLGTSDANQGYWEYLPPGYGGGEDYPLLVFLHGIGENGNGSDGELNKLNNTGLPKLIKNDQWPTTRPFVVVAPQHPGGGCPSPGEVHDFIDFAANEYDINPARVYLTGLSCGAIGAFGYLGEHLDEQIAAMVPIAGDGKGAFNKAKCELGRVPLWAFHGDADNVVNVSGTVEPITGLQMCEPKPDAEMVIYPGVGHDSWTMTYDLSAGHDIYAWLLEHTRP